MAERLRQTALGTQNVQQVLGAGARAEVHYHAYQLARPAPPHAATVAEAEALLAQMPLDRVPEPGPLPQGSRIALPRNAEFVGREEDLQRLAARLKGGGTAAVGQVAAATGLGGIGKTQLASEFVHRYGRFFAGGVFWLSFADPEAVEAQVAGCGGPGALELCPDSAGLPLPDQVALVLAAWQNALPRLLVFDNCEDDGLLQRWRPPTGGARVLVTSRRAEWPAHLGVECLSLDVLARAESVALLRRHRPDLAAEDADLDAIAEELGDLPLALHLAGSYLGRYRHAVLGHPGAYLAELRRPGRLAHASLISGGDSPTGHAQHVARTFALSHQRLEMKDPIDTLAQDLLACAACFAPGVPIPRGPLLSTAPHASPQQGEDALARLLELGLLAPGSEGALVLHRLLAEFVAAAQRASQRSLWARLGAWLRRRPRESEAARDAVEAALLGEALRLNDEGYPAPLLAWQPHLRVVAEACAARKSERAAEFLNALGWHLQEVAEYAGAGQAFERALAISEQVYGPEHPNVASDVNNLGLVLQDLGDLAGARAAFERALAIDEQVYGREHASTQKVAGNLAALGGVEAER